MKVTYNNMLFQVISYRYIYKTIKLYLLFVVADTGPLGEGDHCCTCECREFDRSADFSVLFSEITTYLRTDIPDADVNKLKTFFHYFCHPIASRGQYIKPEIYCTATSTVDILDALFDNKYISPTNLHLLRCIVKTFGGQECKETLQQYTDKYPPCTCMHVTHNNYCKHIFFLNLLVFCVVCVILALCVLLSYYYTLTDILLILEFSCSNIIKLIVIS